MYILLYKTHKDDCVTHPSWVPLLTHMAMFTQKHHLKQLYGKSSWQQNASLLCIGLIALHCSQGKGFFYLQTKQQAVSSLCYEIAKYSIIDNALQKQWLLVYYSNELEGYLWRPGCDCFFFFFLFLLSTADIYMCCLS